ncbi:MAG: S-adenosylmethionine:tRNA ribosyltransferase-isomerase [Rickettsiales bacterium]
MKTSLFDFTLPHGHIATAPANPRDSSRMLVIGDNLQDKNIADMIDFLRAGDVMVFNDTKVIPARLLGCVAMQRLTCCCSATNSAGLSEHMAMFCKACKKTAGC